MENKICPKCKGKMEQGIIIDRAHYSKPLTQIWATHKTFWGGPQNKRDVKTNRCTSCGFLESYAK